MLRYVIDCETNQRITAEEAGKKYSHNSTISAKSHSYRCGWCFHYVTLTSNAKIRDRYFKHSGNDEEKQCQDRQRRYGNNISIDTTLTTTGFNLSLRLIRREKTAHLEVVIPRSISKRILEKHSDERICIDRREYIIRERLSRDSNSYLRGDADISKSFEIKMPPGIEYINPQLRDSGTFFLRSNGMMIRDFVREKEWYYLVSREPIQNIHIQLDKDDPHIVVDGWHIYSVCINAYSETLAAHIQSIYGYHLMKYPVRCAPIWPTYYQDSDEYVFRSGRAYLYVRGEIDDLEPKQCALTSYLEGNLVTVDTDVQNINVFQKNRNAPVLRTVFLRQDGAYYRQRETPKIITCDEDNEIITEGAHETLPKGRRLIIKSEYEATIELYDAEHLIAKHSVKNKYILDNVDYGMTIKIWIGCDLVFMAAYKKCHVSTKEKQSQIAPYLSGETVVVPHRYGGMVDYLPLGDDDKEQIRNVIRTGQMPINLKKYIMSIA